ncbi:hypothetical protein BLS_007810 [Venturia inaequalis]|uniref:Nuclear GTPase SLIP-GC n=1 Tax=Venturia inaequalis TaxID=5025 RepID=A0A8H3UAI7_VENIN|nr:hypothetical protein BLS_007810 [Venturia inaequalis]
MVMTQEDFARFRAKVIEIKGEGSEGALFLGAGLYDPRKFNAESINELTSDDFLWVRCKPRTRWAALKRVLVASIYYHEHPDQKPPANAEFMANRQTYEDTALVTQMNTYDDGLILFQLAESQPTTAINGSSSQPVPNATTTNASQGPSPSQRPNPPATQPNLPTTSPMFEQDAIQGRLSQHATPTRAPSQTGRSYPYGTPARSSGERLAQSQARAQERSPSSRRMPSANGMSPSQYNARAAIDEIRLAEANRKALERAQEIAKSGSHGSSAVIKPESTTPTATSVAPEQATPRSPSPVPDRPVTEFFESQNEEVGPSVAFQGKNLIQQVVNSDSLELLEDAVQIGGHILDSMKHELDGSASKDATHWLGQMEKLKQQMTRTRTVVGVVGNTGAGKSSVINALLDEERVVPTSCMRACTAVITEISWNESTNPWEKYRAEIEFIDRESWEKELEALISDMTDGNGQPLKEASMTSDSEAGVALAKMKAVYPQVTKEELATGSAKKFADHGPVKKVLGTTRRIKDKDAASFYRQLQAYVDSVQDKERENVSPSKREKRKMEFWPLIKVVRVYTRSDALSTGAVLVDLPGVQDSNAARAAVAASYLKQCTGLWVVAPITRAVNDKAAKKLMGDQFKRQMKFDGMVSNLTFICSKTDDISITEAAGSLGLEHRIQAASEKKDRLIREREELARDVGSLQAEVDALQDSQGDLDEKIEVWESLLEDLRDGKRVLAPHEKKKNKKQTTNKRKRKSGPSKSRKRVSHGDSDDDFIDDDSIAESESEDDPDSESEKENDSDEGFGKPLTTEQVEAKLDEFKAAKKQAREDVKLTRAKILETKKKVRQVKEDIAVLDSEMSAVCIAGRNDYSKGLIQEDYAAGIKELDEEAAEEEDEDEYDPDKQLRDYEELARSLPVFCVSSRAYQKLSGRLKKDSATPGFTSVEETGMLQLKAHCKKLTETGRLNHCKVFLNGLSSLLLSLNLWGSKDGTGKNMSKEEKAKENTVVERLLKNLEDAMDKTTNLCTKRVKEALVKNIQAQYANAHAEAQKVALPTAASWGAPRTDGGLHHGTYKAICRRDGGPYREHDFNRALTEPLQKVLASGWEKCFQRCIPVETGALARDMKVTIQKAHQAIVKRATERQGLGIVGADLLAQKLETWIQLFVDLAGKMNTSIMEKQRDANRELAPVIAFAMQHAYTLCTNEAGRGSYMRMKAHMTSHVEGMVQKMYPAATATVWGHLEAMFKAVSEELEEEKDAIYNSMYQDYMNVLCGAQIDEMMPKWERTMRGSIAEEVAKTDILFKRLLDGESRDVILGKVKDNEATEEVKEGSEGEAEAEAEAAAEKEKPGEASVKAESPPHDSVTGDVPMVDNDNETGGDLKVEVAEAAEADNTSQGNEMDVDQ